MTSSGTAEPFTRDGDPPVRGLLHRAPVTGDGLVLTHGAGSDARTPLLRAVAAAFVAEGTTVLCCDLPFRQARRTGPPSPAGAERDRRGLAAALEMIGALVAPEGRRFVGGHSYGGRQASMLLAASPSHAHGLVLLSYPLHSPSKPDRPRTAHFPELRVPTLFVHGVRDPFGSIDEIEAARALIPAPTALVVVPRAAHALHADSATAREVVASFRRLVG